MRTCGVTVLAVGLLALMSATTASAASEPADIPFTIEDGNIVVEVELAPGHPLPFIFDSGLSDGNIVTVEAAKALGLAPQEEMQYKDTSGGGGSGRLTKVPKARVGAAMLSNQTYAITDLPKEVTHRKGKPSIAGFLGAPLMEGAIVCIDYRRKVMRRWDSANFDVAGLSSIPMPLNHGLPTIGIRIDGEPATVLVDSGNNEGVEVFPAFAGKSDFLSRYPDLRTREGIAGSGRSFGILSGTASAVAIGSGAILRKVPFSLMPQAINPAWGIDGLAGFEILSRLNPCLDRDGQRLMWDPRTLEKG